jgi:hypothetical protein
MSRYLAGFIVASAAAGLGCALYVPFLGNPMVFDDLPFFSSGSFAYFATTPLGLNLRLLPYFTLTFPQVLWGQFPPWHHAEIHRVFSLAFHVLCALALWKLLHDLVRLVEAGDFGSRNGNSRAPLLASIGALAFVVHPVAVYAAGYLVQRTILLATLFSLLSLILFLHGLARRQMHHALSAAFFYTLAVFSKEHSLLVPAVAIVAVPLVGQELRYALRYTGLYLCACLPAAVTIFALVRWVVGHAYEPGFDMLLAQLDGIPWVDKPGGPWLVSAVTQAGLFFRYALAWLAPDTSMMSIDVRIDFARTWTLGWAVGKVAAYVAFGAIGLLLLLRRGKWGLVGFGMLYAWILFAVELTSVRFQEPYVLYRSYLWAPGYLIAAAGLLNLVSFSIVVAAAALAVPVLFYQAHDRLQSFSSNLSLWSDAAAKLPGTAVPLGSRVLFGMAREQVYAGQLHQAAVTADRCIALYSQTWHCNFSRGAVHARFGEYDRALIFFDRALAFDPKSGLIHTHRGMALEKLGRVDEARVAYGRASELGFIGGDYRLGMLDDPGTGGVRVLYDASRVKKPGRTLVQ